MSSVQQQSKKITLALDAMGGDHAPKAVIAGAAHAIAQNSQLQFIFCGDETLIVPLIRSYPELSGSQIIHTKNIVPADMRPSQALRQGKQSSMRFAIDCVKEGRADGMISSGNTGALMAMAKLVLRTLPGIDRPAIAALIPTLKGESVMLDLGANIECTAENLVQFALMGDAFARAILKKAQPNIGLLNVGSEEMKGHEILREAARVLRKGKLPLQFHGYIEGDEITKGVVDVIVTDGFTGNVALKTMEGTAKACLHYVKSALTSSFRAKIGAFFAAPALRVLSKKADPRRHNGAMFLGLNGVAVKSHGGSDEIGFANAIAVTFDLISHRINQHIIDELSQYHRNMLKSLGGEWEGDSEEEEHEEA
jgi:glycerol-3-phosphate acyltransferase PlsX